MVAPNKCHNQEKIGKLVIYKMVKYILCFLIFIKINISFSLKF